jgi:FAD binding domain
MSSFPRAAAPLDPTALRARVDGDIVLPGDDAWDAARLAWNLAVDQHPAVVAFPESAADVAAVVAYAAEHELRVAMQGTGHGAGARGGELGGAILVKTERMRGIEIDPVSRTGRVEAGVLWAEVAEAAGRYGLAALAGSSPDVGVVGYTLGGGLSWLGRRHGLAASNVVSVEIVTADGAIRRIDAETDPDLFWAVRGGGGSFGAVTAIEFALFPLAEVYAGVMLWPIERASEILHAWREWTAEMPEDMTTVGRLLQLPPIPDIPEPLRGRSFVAVQAFYLGSPRRRSSTSTWIPSTPFPAWVTGCSSTISPPRGSTPSSRPRGRGRARLSCRSRCASWAGRSPRRRPAAARYRTSTPTSPCSPSGSPYRRIRAPPCLPTSAPSVRRSRRGRLRRHISTSPSATSPATTCSARTPTTVCAR